MRTRAPRTAGKDRLASGAEGFTLIELLVVILVLGILAVIAIFNLSGVSSSAVLSSCATDFATTETALAAYKLQLGSYPAGTGSASATDSDPGASPNFSSGAAPLGVNAARAGGELEEASGRAPNIDATIQAGPWLQGAPMSSGHYAIWVANDGSGLVQVLDASGHVPAGATQSVNDCATLAAASGAATTTSTSSPTSTTSTTSTTTTVPPTTTTTAARTAPSFTSANQVTFSRSRGNSFTISAVGTPTPSLRETRSLPRGVSFNSRNGVLSGTPRSRGTYRLTFIASNGIAPNATQSFTLFVR